MPNRSEWETLQQQYKQACEKFLSDPDSDDDVQIISADDEKSQTTVDQPVLVESNVGGVSVDANENSSSDKNGESSTTCEALSSQQSASNNDEPMVEASQDAEGATAEENAMPIVIVCNSHKFIFVWIIKFFLILFPSIIQIKKKITQFL